MSLQGTSPSLGRTQGAKAKAADAAALAEHHSMLGLSHLGKSPTWSFPGRPPADADEKVPGPGTYAVPATEVTSRFGKGPNFTFGTGAREVLSKAKLPGPGSYTVSREFGKQAIAYSLSPRKRAAEPRATSKDPPGPGPGAHSVSSRFPEGPKFSVSPRREPSRAQLPGPGDYDVAVSEANTERQPRCCFGTATQANPASGSLNTPGPGAYTPPTAVGEGPKFSMKGRFMDPKHELTPGPGSFGGHWSTLGDYRHTPGRGPPVAPPASSPRRAPAAAATPREGGNSGAT